MFRRFKRYGLVLAAALAVSAGGVVVASEAQATYVPAIPGTHHVTHTCGSASIDYVWTVTGSVFQMDSATYHGPGQYRSSGTLLDSWLSPTGGGAGGYAVKTFALGVTNGTVATKTSNQTGTTWGALSLTSTPSSGHNLLYSNFYYNCPTYFDLSSWATYPGETPPFDPSGTYTANLTCETPSPVYSDHEAVSYSVGKTSTDHYTFFINSVTNTSGDLKTSWQVSFKYGTAPGVTSSYPIAGTGTNTNSFAFEWHSSWPKPAFDEQANFFLSPDQCQALSVPAGGGW